MAEKYTMEKIMNESIGVIRYSLIVVCWLFFLIAEILTQDFQNVLIMQAHHCMKQETTEDYICRLCFSSARIGSAAHLIALFTQVFALFLAKSNSGS